MTIAVVPEQTLEDIPLACLRESSTNPRRSFDAAALAELSASIAEIGVQVPLLVRLCTYAVDLNGEEVGDVADSAGVSEGNHYEIVAGARRYRAAVLAGKTDVPCIVREISDDEGRRPSRRRRLRSLRRLRPRVRSRSW